MDSWPRPPAGPRGARGAAAEDGAVQHLLAQGWAILGRNVRVGRDEVDIVALEPGDPPVLVIVEVRSRSGPRFGAAVESVDQRKVGRLYRAGRALARRTDDFVAIGALGAPGTPRPPWRVDLLAVRRQDGGWRVEAHLRGLLPS